MTAARERLAARKFEGDPRAETSRTPTAASARLCAFCSLAFHTPNAESAPDGCECLGYGCGCRIKREQKEAA